MDEGAAERRFPYEGSRRERALRRDRHRHRPGRPVAGRPAGRRRHDASRIVERERFGGTCVNNGCIPTKTLVASARAAHVARRAADYGVRIDGPVSVDMKRGEGAQGPGRPASRARASTTWLRGTNEPHA